MSQTAYLFEKAAYAADSLASMAEDVRRLAPGSPAQRDVSCHVQVATRHALKSLAVLAGTDFDPAWVLRSVREGRSAWDKTIKPELELALFGPPTGTEIANMPRQHEHGEEPELDEEEAIEAAIKAVAALLDLVEVVRRHRAHEAEGADFERHLAWALNGATKVVSNLLAAEWDVKWPQALVSAGRAALDPVLEVWQRADEIHSITRAELGPLDEAWLADADPERAPDKDVTAERRRRAEVTEDTRASGDLVAPPRYATASLARLADSDVPEHRECVAWARDPKGVLVLKGGYRSALHAIQWAIGRYWFVDALETVRALRWHDLVELNLVAQNRAHWEVRRLLLRDLCPVHHEGGEIADPGYADNLLAHRLERRLVTVVTAEFDTEIVGVRATTLARLREARTIVLPDVSDDQRQRLGLDL